MLGRLLARTPSRHPPVRRFQAHLIVEYDAIFSFLFDPTLDATNWRAEQALRPAVVTRKMCGGGNRTALGAQAQQVLASVLRTAHQRGLDMTDLLVTMLRASKPAVPVGLQSSPAVH
jgi:transposase